MKKIKKRRGRPVRIGYKLKVLGSWINFLRKQLKGFIHLTDRQQLVMARMALDDMQSRFQHNRHDDAMYMPYQNLEKEIGRDGFRVANEKVKMFHISNNWVYSGSEKLIKGSTRAYILSSEVKLLRDKWLAQLDNNKLDTLFVLKVGSLSPYRPANLNAILSKDMSNKPVLVWGKSSGVFISERVRINTAKLIEGRSQLERIQKNKQKDLFTPSEIKTDIQNRIDVINLFLKLSNVDHVGRGYVIQQYVESPAGRLYVINESLQNAPKQVRSLALHGYYDYDIENCHYSIFSQLCSKLGYETKCINEYLSNKSETRQSISDQVGIEVDQTKMALLATIYGANLIDTYYNAIPKEIGRGKARELYKNKIFDGIASEVKKGRDLILESIQPNSKGYITNLAGKIKKVIKRNGGSIHNKKQLLAHLIQGIEAVALRAMVLAIQADQNNQVVLLMHDGLACENKTDTTKLEQAIFDATGYKFEVSCERITWSPNMEFKQ